MEANGVSLPVVLQVPDFFEFAGNLIDESAKLLSKSLQVLPSNVVERSFLKELEPACTTITSCS
jgi:hypothetical protein